MRAAILCSGLALLALFSCKKQTDQVVTDPILSYQPLQQGKYITYRTDSIVFTNIQRNIEVHSYLEKQVVDTTLTDNTGRTGYRVFRFLSDTTGTQGWSPAGSFVVYPTKYTLEVVENNLRVVKLSEPIMGQFTWKGNHYLPTDPYQGAYNFNFDDNINVNNWDYTYTRVGSTDTLNGVKINDVISVEKTKDTFNVATPAGFGVNVGNPNLTAYLTYSKDDYANGIGLIFQQLVMWEYQPPGTNGNSAYYTGFAVQRSMVDHN